MTDHPLSAAHWAHLVIARETIHRAVAGHEAELPTAAAWEATGPRTATVTFAGLAGGPGSGASFVIRADVEVDETGERFTATHSFMLVAADGTVLTSVPEGGTASGTRLPAQSGGAGTPLAGFPTWTPASPETGTPTP